ncbi:hypothetical protein Tco_0620914 [Tanacetum coccineum]
MVRYWKKMRKSTSFNKSQRKPLSCIGSGLRNSDECPQHYLTRVQERNQGDDLMPTIEEGEVIEEFKTRGEDLDTKIDDYLSYCDDDDKKIHIDFLEDMDACRDNEMGDIIFGEPFLREVGIKTKRYQDRNAPDFPIFYTGLREGNIDEYVLYKVEDTATYLVNYVKFWDDWEVDRYGNTNLDYCSEDQYAVSIKEDTTYPCLHSPKTTKGMKINTPYPEDSIRRIQDMESI